MLNSRSSGQPLKQLCTAASPSNQTCGRLVYYWLSWWPRAEYHTQVGTAVSLVILSSVWRSQRNVRRKNVTFRKAGTFFHSCRRIIPTCYLEMLVWGFLYYLLTFPTYMSQHNDCWFMGKYLLLTYTWSPYHFCPLLCARGAAATDSIWCHWLQRVPYGWLNQQLSWSAIWLLWLSWFQRTLFVLINLPQSSTFGGRKPPLFSSKLLPDSRDVFAVFVLLFSTVPF